MSAAAVKAAWGMRVMKCWWDGRGATAGAPGKQRHINGRGIVTERRQSSNFIRTQHTASAYAPAARSTLRDQAASGERACGWTGRDAGRQGGMRCGRAACSQRRCCGGGQGARCSGCNEGMLRTESITRDRIRSNWKRWYAQCRDRCNDSSLGSCCCSQTGLPIARRLLHDNLKPIHACI